MTATSCDGNLYNKWTGTKLPYLHNFFQPAMFSSLAFVFLAVALPFSKAQELGELLWRER